MGDLMLRGDQDLINSKKEMRIKQLQIQIDECVSQIKGLEQRKEDIIKLETSKIDLEIMKRTAQIEVYEVEKDKLESIETK